MASPIRSMARSLVQKSVRSASIVHGRYSSSSTGAEGWTSRRQYTTSPKSNNLPPSPKRPEEVILNTSTSRTIDQTKSTPPPIASTSRLNRYLPQLKEISDRTGVSLSSLVVSFAILHELTAIVPVILLFFAFQVLGAGAGIVGWIKALRPENVEGNSTSKMGTMPTTTGDVDSGNGGVWDWRVKVAEWYEEGERRVEKVGKKYGILGYAKTAGSAEKTPGETDRAQEQLRQTSQPSSSGNNAQLGQTGQVITTDGVSSGAAGKVASAISAYVIVKAILPLRVAVSIGAAPAFARLALNPVERFGSRFRKPHRVPK